MYVPTVGPFQHPIKSILLTSRKVSKGEIVGANSYIILES